MGHGCGQSIKKSVEYLFFTCKIVMDWHVLICHCVRILTNPGGLNQKSFYEALLLWKKSRQTLSEFYTPMSRIGLRHVQSISFNTRLYFLFRDLFSFFDLNVCLFRARLCCVAVCATMTKYGGLRMLLSHCPHRQLHFPQCVRVLPRMHGFR